MPTRWDVFISHASEDKEPFVRDLALALRRQGLRVWYDEFSLNLGDSLSRSLDQGLANSEFGIVVLSPHFFSKEWPRRELDGLVAREISGSKIILPVWHNMTRDEILRHSPTLADRVAVETSRGIDSVVQSILGVLQPLPLRSLELIEDTMSRLHHELVSPIDGIIAHIEWLIKRVASEPTIDDLFRSRAIRKLSDIRKIANVIELEIEKLGPMVTDLATFSTSRFDLRLLLVTVIELLRNQAADRKIDIRLAIDPAFLVTAKRELLLLLVYNLVKNSVEYYDFNEPSPYIEIRAEIFGDSVEISFSDNGIGIVSGEERLIFERFKKGSNAASVRPGGIGVGLSVGRWIAQRHGGVLEIGNLSKPTVFRLNLPINFLGRA